MYFWNHSFVRPEENLAWDEALVEVADRSRLEASDSTRIFDLETIRVWQFEKPTVVVGRGSRVADEVYLDRCRDDGVPVMRRASGGSTVVAGPGCCMYSVLVSLQQRPAWRGLDIAHQQIMLRMARATSRTLESLSLESSIDLRGTCDLTIESKKFSGNALRCKRNFLLYHGTILAAMPLDWIARYLREPPRQPQYREKRQHHQFVRNLLPNSGVSIEKFVSRWTRDVQECWGATETWENFPLHEELKQEQDRLLTTRYLDSGWHLER